MATYIWRQGSTLNMSLSIVDGDFSGDEEARCTLKRKSGSDPAGVELLEFAVSFAPEASPTPASWDVTGTPEQSLLIRPGNYFVDVRIDTNTSVIISKKAVVRLVKTVTTNGDD
jgi:hypothetical protein